ncbi:intracellular motility protein A [Corynebacterium diphtheriae]|uniref:intracellular motility protein A n=1 Tax=Corynebacterium diphtheriae TaxID=1717 RepID=UPI0013C615B5|nr:intracellular motility protein A [Corynebacterium diphtheriae]MBG9289296.1 intracellular motility protein A [Corynebacterium diphtheriae bv. gravis]MBG9344468.1 intracellular motility protein A [Corynebacterium diphtheriae bv. gravis]MBG9351257.1 intracellular motility protein A [Corynebacterium diphtheriae bv. gravis]CAB0505288.1 intracellular motility protein A [Corynebacterium diphtheriae]CAB0641277.1 intracellular motility protein A [Corynebacterium diphtheriae]
MKRNKRVIASAALSVSLATSGVAPVAWADEMHVKCPQEFHGGSDFGGDVKAKVEEHLQRNCELTTDQISRHSIRDEKFSETTEAGTGGEQHSVPPLKVDDVKAGDKNITGSVFLLPGQKKTVQLILPNFRVLTKDVELKGNSGEEGNTSEGKRVLFVFNVPDDVVLKENDRLLFSLRGDSPSSGAENNKYTPVYVKPADKGAESQPEQTPDGGNDQAPGDGAGEKPGKPHVPDEKPDKPSVPGADDNPGTGKGNLSFGSIFGVIAGLGGIVALVMGVVKFFNQNSDVARFLQPLRNFFSLFKF